MAKKKFLTLLPIYAVFVNGDFIFASEEEEDCEGCIEFLHQKDLEFIKEEYDVDDDGEFEYEESTYVII